MFDRFHEVTYVFPFHRLTTPPVTLGRLLTIAFPMILSQATETVMMFTDRLFLSRLSLEHMSSAMTGGLASFVFGSLFFGWAGYVNTLVAHAHGAGRVKGAIHSMVQGSWLLIFAYPFILLMIPVLTPLFPLLGHSPLQVELESQYFAILMAGSILVLGRTVLGAYFTGIGKTSLVLVANVTGMIINIPLTYLLVFGIGPFPTMGISGAAVGTIVGSLVTNVVLFTAFILRPEVKKTIQEAGWKSLLRLRKDLFKKLVRFGFPVGFELFLNVFAFNLFLQLMHSYGPDTAAAVTITFNYDLLAFIPMVGMGIAVSAMVGQEQGAKRVGGARKVVRLALKLALGYAGFMALTFVLAAPWLVRVFADGSGIMDQNVQNTAEVLLRMAALYTLADATQLVFGGTLRGAGDTRWVMIFNACLHWLMAIITVLGILVMDWPPALVFSIFVAMLIIGALAMILRYHFSSWESIEVLDDLKEGEPIPKSGDAHQDALATLPVDSPEI